MTDPVAFAILLQILPDWVYDLRDLAGVADELQDFATSPIDYLWEQARPRIVDAILTAWRWVLENVIGQFFEIIETGIIDGIAIPIRDAFTLAGSAVLDALESLRLWAEGGLMELGIAAPFAIIVSWLILVIVVAVIFQLIWGLIEAYLPTESITGALGSFRTAIAGDES